MPKNRAELAGATWPPTFILRPAINRHGARLHGKFVVTLDGQQLCISRQPLSTPPAFCSPTASIPRTPIATRHAGSDFDAMTSTVGTAARWTVREDSTVSPTFVRWEAFPASGSGRPCAKTSGQHLTPCLMPIASTTPMGAPA